MKKSKKSQKKAAKMANKKALAATLLASALLVPPAVNAEDVSDWEGLKSGLTSGSSMKMTSDITVTESLGVNGKNNTLDMNVKTLQGNGGTNNGFYIFCGSF